MVTAGVYMVGRNAVLFSHAPMVMEIVAIVGVLTALMAASIGLVQNDIKRVLAYSTVSQLGYMFLAMGVGAFAAGAFHLMTHAFFKALLFLCSGSVIHAMAGQQDMRHMGGLKKYLPVTYVTMLVGTLAIAGMPPLSGFFSKDEILFKAFLENKVIWGVAVVTALMTAFYMYRLMSLTFFGTPYPAWEHAAGTAATERPRRRRAMARPARVAEVDNHPVDPGGRRGFRGLGQTRRPGRRQCHRALSEPPRTIAAASTRPAAGSEAKTERGGAGRRVEGWNRGPRQPRRAHRCRCGTRRPGRP
jgi:NADH:ubiquinone oxidoreductase subunit 5 (subunit L)/multisubunit Na+/H+ antiporter MnhA subunit